MSEPQNSSHSDATTPTAPSTIPRTTMDVLQTICIAQRCCCLAGALDEFGSDEQHDSVQSIADLMHRAPLVKEAFVLMAWLQDSSGNDDCETIHAGPLIPDDWLLRLATRCGRPDTTETPPDLYTQDEVIRWMSGTAITVGRYASMYSHNISRQIAGASKGHLRETIVHTFLTPLYFVCHYNGWEAGLEYIDSLWAAGWFLNLTAISRLRTDVWQCSLKENVDCKTLSFQEFCVALDGVTMKPDSQSSQFVAQDDIERLVERIRSMVGRLRTESSDLESWIRELHNISPVVTTAFLLLMAQRRSKTMDSPQLERLLRIVAEIDCDIKGILRDPFYLLSQTLVHTVASQPNKVHAHRALRYLVHGRVSVPDVIAARFSGILDRSDDWPPSSKGIASELRRLMRQDVSQATRIAYELLHGRERDQRIEEALSKYQEFFTSSACLALPELARAIANFLSIRAALKLVNPHTPSIPYKLGLTDRQDVEVVASTDEKGRCCAIGLIYKHNVCSADQYPTVLADAQSIIAAIDLTNPHSLDPDALKAMLIHSHAQNSMVWVGLDRASVTDVVVLPLDDDTERTGRVVEMAQVLHSTLGGVFHMVSIKGSEVQGISNQSSST